MIATDLLRSARGHAARYGQRTREDALELTAVFWQVASRQARDAGAGLASRAGRSAERARRAAGTRR